MWGSVVTARRLRTGLLLAAAGALFVLLLLFPEAAGNGVRRGLSVCGQLLIPSLFPFLVLTGFLIRSGLLKRLSRVFEPLMRRVFGFSGEAAAAVLLSMLGGYPTGAAAVAGLLQREEISVEEGRRLLRCAVNAGPAFVIGGIGVGMLGSVEAGLLLLVAHLTASLITSLCERAPAVPHTSLPSPAVPLGSAVQDSLHAATESLLSMCSFVLLASTGLSLFDALCTLPPHSLWRCLFSGVLEVSTGCLEAASAGELAPFLIGAMLGFGGLAVHGQIAAVTSRFHLLDRGFLRARLLHALLGGTLSFLLFRWFPPPNAAVAALASLSAFHEGNTAVSATALLALMLLCILFLQTLPDTENRRFRA